MDDSGDRLIDFEEFKVCCQYYYNWLARPLLQKVMTEVENNGWKKFGSVDGKNDITEEEIRNLFNMIDKDKSGSLSLRVLC